MQQKFALNLIFMIFSPVLALFYGLREKSFVLKRWVVIFFITLYGSVFSYSAGNDAYVHQKAVYDNYIRLSFSDFYDRLIDILLFQPQSTTNDDVYIHVLSFFVGSVLQIPELFFVFVSFIYAYFFAGAMIKMFAFLPQPRLSWVFYLFAIAFILWRNLEGINVVRTWTGFWVLFYGALSFYQTGKRKYLFLILIPPLFHVGFYAMVLPAWIVLAFGSRPLVYSALFVLSFGTNIFDRDIVFEQLEKTEVGASKAQGYEVETQSDSSVRYNASRGNTWYRTLQKTGVQFFSINIIAFLFIFSGIFSLKMNYLEAHIFSIGLLSKVLSNGAWFISALTNRSNDIAALFILAALLLYWQRTRMATPTYVFQKTLNIGLKIGSLLLIPYIIYCFAANIYFISFFMIAFPFLPWFYNDINLSIRDFLGLFL